jgi:hypothetical protein
MWDNGQLVEAESFINFTIYFIKTCPSVWFQGMCYAVCLIFSGYNDLNVRKLCRFFFVNEAATYFKIRCKFKLSIVVRKIILNLATFIRPSTPIVCKTDGKSQNR